MPFTALTSQATALSANGGLLSFNYGDVFKEIRALSPTHNSEETPNGLTYWYNQSLAQRRQSGKREAAAAAAFSSAPLPGRNALSSPSPWSGGGVHCNALRSAERLKSKKRSVVVFPGEIDVNPEVPLSRRTSSILISAPLPAPPGGTRGKLEGTVPPKVSRPTAFHSVIPGKEAKNISGKSPAVSINLRHFDDSLSRCSANICKAFMDFHIASNLDFSLSETPDRNASQQGEGADILTKIILSGSLCRCQHNSAGGSLPRADDAADREVVPEPDAVSSGGEVSLWGGWSDCISVGADGNVLLTQQLTCNAAENTRTMRLLKPADVEYANTTFLNDSSVESILLGTSQLLFPSPPERAPIVGNLTGTPGCS